MTRELLMGIDVGTQSTRVALLDPDGNVIASHSGSYDLHTPRPGWAEQDPDTLVGSHGGRHPARAHGRGR